MREMNQKSRLAIAAGRNKVTSLRLEKALPTRESQPRPPSKAHRAKAREQDTSRKAADQTLKQSQPNRRAAAGFAMLTLCLVASLKDMLLAFVA